MIRFRVLGAAELWSPDRRELRSVLAQPKRVALLAYLAIAMPGRFHRRDSLLPLFWPELDQDHARSALRQAVHHLRHALGQDALVSRGKEEIGLDIRHFWCDAAAFEQTLDANESARALDLYGGDLLPGFFISDAPDFEQWLDLERDRLRTRAATAARQLADREDAHGNGQAAIHWGRVTVRLSPGDERSVRHLMELLAKSGDRVGASRVYDEFAERLALDFELQPSAETRSLVTRVRAADPLPTSYSPPAFPTPPVFSPEAEALAVAPSVVSQEAGRGSRAWRRPTTVALGAGVLIAAVATGFAFRPRPVPAPAPQIAVAVLPFPIRGRQDLSYLREGLVDLLSVKLDGTSSLRSVDPRAILSTIESEDANSPLDARWAARIAQRLGAGWYVMGDVVEIAGRLQISAALYEANSSSPPAAQAAVEGETEHLFALVDELAGRLLAGRISGRDSALTHLAGMTTRSLPALKAFLDGEREFRAGRESRAVARFTDAIGLDTSFALAYYRLASASRWSTVPFDSSFAIAREAVKRSHRLPRLAASLLQGFIAYMMSDAPASERIFRDIRVGHPDNVEAWFMEGEALFHYNTFRGRSFVEARPIFRQVLRLDPDNPHALLHLARIAAAENQVAELDSLVERFLLTSPDAERAIEMRALRASIREDATELRALTAELRLASDVVIDAVLRGVASFTDNFPAAVAFARAYETAGRSTVHLQWGAVSLGQVVLAHGRRHDSAAATLASLDPDWLLEARALFASNPVVPVARHDLMALRDSVQNWRPHAAPGRGPFQHHDRLHPQVKAYTLGLLSARIGDLPAAHAHVAALDQLARPASDSGLSQDLAFIVRAEVARAAGDPAKALSEIMKYRFDRWPPVEWQVFHVGGHARFLRAELLYTLGRDAEALRWFSAFPESNGRDLMLLAPARLRRAEIHERLGNREQAITEYTRFIQLWKESDPELRPVVARAERAVTRLRNGH